MTSSQRIERLAELESTVELRRQEVASLLGRKREMEDALGMSREATVLSHPVLVYCGNGSERRDIRMIPPEQVGNVVTQLKAAEQDFKVHNAALQRTIAEMELHIRHHTKEQHKLAEKVQLMTDITGLPAQGISGTPREERRYKHTPMASHAATVASMSPEGSPDRDGNVGAAAGGGAAEFGATPLASAKRESDDLALRLSAVVKDVRAAEILRTKTTRAINELSQTLAGKKELVEKTLVLHNDIRCADRDVRERKAELQKLLEEHEAIDVHLKSVLDDQHVHPTRAILDRDVAQLKHQVSDCVETQRRAQDRVVKAQEYRILQLEKRLKIIAHALKSQNLEQRVERAVAQKTLVATRDSRSVSPSASATSGATGGGSAAVDGKAQQQQYDVDAIIPPHEKMHPAIFKLLASEKAQLNVAVSRLQILIKEKEEAMDATAAKVVGLTRAYDDAVGQLERASEQAGVTEQEQQERVLSAVTGQRERYTDLLREKLQYTRQTGEAKRKPSSARTSPEFSGATTNGGSSTERSASRKDKSQSPRHSVTIAASASRVSDSVRPPSSK